MTHLSDEFLLAYLDGQLEKGQAAELSQLAGINAEVSRRLMRLKRTQAQILETFGGFAREEIELPRGAFPFEEGGGKRSPDGNGQSLAGVKATEKKAVGGGKLLFVIAVFAGALAGGYGATLLKAQRAPLPQKDTDRVPAALMQTVTWASEIARFHSHFPRETLIPHPDAIANPDLIGMQLTKVTAKGVKTPDFSNHGFTLYRGQMLNYRQDRMMQLTYASKTEPPLTLYVLPAPELADSGFATQAMGSNRAVSWVSDRVRFFLTGEKNEEDLKVLAAVAQSQMPRK
jgi:anti-sigma factor RsiW